MSILQVQCQECNGLMRMEAKHITIQRCEDTLTAAYQFVCMLCNKLSFKDADQRIVEVLYASGAKLHRWTFPEEMFEIHDGPPITADDILDFHFNADSILQRVLENA